MKPENLTLSICPKCGKTYTGHPALSRVDNRTTICSDCGIREALGTLNVGDDEKEKILQIIKEHTE